MTRKEILQAMLNGDRVSKLAWANPDNPIKYLEYDSNTIMTLVYKDGVTQPHTEVFANTDEWELYTAPEWFDGIPSQGIICYVDQTTVDIIYTYDRVTRKFGGLYKQYSNVNPMSTSEIELLYITPYL